MSVKNANTRKAIKKSVRFEVFKRDSFCCQYCGKSAPDVILNCDHIKPVAKGGTNDILNLITACFDCNSGKSDRELSDQTMLSKQKKQVDDLNERREQLKMLHEYRDSLSDIDQEKVHYISDLFETEATGRGLNDVGLRKVRSWVKKFDYVKLLEAVEKSLKQYLQFNDEGEATPESASKAFTMIPRIAKIIESGKDIPNKEAYYIRGIIRNRFHYINERLSVSLILECANLGITYESLTKLAKDAKNWSEFRGCLEATINKYSEAE